MRCLLAVLLMSIGLAALAPAARAAETTTTVTGTVAHVYGPAESSPPCIVATFVRWADVPGTVRASATLAFADGNREIGTKAAPFDDAFAAYGFDASAPAGQHQLYVDYASIQGAGPRDCAQDPDMRATRAAYPATAQVLLTIDKARTPACVTAKGTLAARRQTVAKRRAAVRKAASGAAKRKAKRQLRAATRKQERASRAVAAAC